MSVHLNIAEGCSKRSGNERKRFYEIARGSLIEADAALDLVLELKYKTDEELQQVGSHLVSIFRQLSGLIGKWAPPQ